MIFNKDTKTPGGKTRFSTNIRAIKRWEVNAPTGQHCGNVFTSTFNMKNKTKSFTRILKEEDVKSLMNILTEIFIPTFSEQPLISTSTSFVALKRLLKKC